MTPLPRNAMPTAHASDDLPESEAYLVFQLDNCDYAISVGDVREIITSVSLSTVPGSPNYLSGVTNLRGRILPMVDLRKRFGYESTELKNRDCFIILTLECEGRMAEVGIRVDSVSEVARINLCDIDAAPAMNDYADRLVFNGVAKISDGIKLILDTQTLVTQLRKDIQHLCGTAVESAPQETTVH